MPRKYKKKYIEVKEVLYDDYSIAQDYEKLKSIVLRIEKDIYKFVGPIRGKNASIRARNNLNDARIICERLRKNILTQRQDNEGLYY